MRVAGGWRAMWRGAALAGALVLVTSAAQPARALAHGTWRIAAVLASPGEVVNLYAVAAIGSRDAWAVGSATPLGGADHGLVEHWNGRLWADWSPAARVANLKSSDLTAIAAPARTDVWIGGSGATDSYALFWNGSRWRQLWLRKPILISAIAAFSPRDVWVFGDDNGPAVDRWDGHRWHFSWAPAFGARVSALSPSDIWSAGARGIRKQRTLVLSHWAGGSWRLIRLPRVSAKAGDYLARPSVLALSDTEVWVSAEITARDGIHLVRPVLLRWDGSSWAVFRCPLTKTVVTQMIPDGSGGLWLAGGAGPPMPGYFLHFLAGGWTWIQAPQPKASRNPIPWGIAAVPGTRQLLAVGTVIVGGEGIIYHGVA